MFAAATLPVDTFIVNVGGISARCEYHGCNSACTSSGAPALPGKAQQLRCSQHIEKSVDRAATRSTLADPTRSSRGESLTMSILKRYVVVVLLDSAVAGEDI